MMYQRILDQTPKDARKTSSLHSTVKCPDIPKAGSPPQLISPSKKQSLFAWEGPY